MATAPRGQQPVLQKLPIRKAAQLFCLLKQDTTEKVYLRLEGYCRVLNKSPKSITHFTGWIESSQVQSLGSLQTSSQSKTSTCHCGELSVLAEGWRFYLAPVQLHALLYHSTEVLNLRSIHWDHHLALICLCFDGLDLLELCSSTKNQDSTTDSTDVIVAALHKISMVP